MTLQTLHSELERLFAECTGDWTESVIAALSTAVYATARAVRQEECPHPADRIKTQEARRNVFRTCLACGALNVTPAPKEEPPSATNHAETHPQI